MEKLPPKRKQIVQILDAFLGSEKAKKTGEMDYWFSYANLIYISFQLL